MAGPASLGNDEVHAWHGIVAGPADRPRNTDLAVLSAAERARCERFARAADGARFAAMHAAVRRLLAGYLPAGAAAIEFGRSQCCECGRDDHGPPRVSWPPTDVSFNLSGSGGHWLLAVTRRRRVGADIEVPRDLDVAEMAAAALTETERGYLNAQPQSDRRELFYRCWTRKEAVLKACGVGLAGSLRTLDTQPARVGPVELRHRCRGGPGSWRVQDLPSAGGGWIAAVAQPAADAAAVTLREVPDSF